MLLKLKLLLNIIRYYAFGGVNYAKSLGVVIGSNCRVYTRKFGSEPFLITIGNSVTITQGVSFITHDGSTWLVRDSENKRYYHYAPISVGNRVFIGANATILPGVDIGDDVIIAAGSVVNKSIVSNSVVAGVPAKQISTFESYQLKTQELFVHHDEIFHISDYKERVLHAIELEKNKK